LAGKVHNLRKFGHDFASQGLANGYDEASGFLITIRIGFL
jgi:hypothetical protein